MVVETTTTIAGLVPTSPLESDPVTEGGAQLRLLKAVMQADAVGQAQLAAQGIAIGLKEAAANKSTSVATDQASDVKFPSVKAVYDWATGLFVAKTSTTGSAILPSGTTAQRDGTPSAGYTRFNSDYGKPEVYNGSAWSGLGGADGTGGDAVFYVNDNTIDFPYTLAAGKNAHSVGPITINATVTLNGRWVIS